MITIIIPNPSPVQAIHFVDFLLVVSQEGGPRDPEGYSRVSIGDHKILWISWLIRDYIGTCLRKMAP